MKTMREIKRRLKEAKCEYNWVSNYYDNYRMKKFNSDKSHVNFYTELIDSLMRRRKELNEEIELLNWILQN